MYSEYTHSLSHKEASIRLLSLSFRGQIEWKPQSQINNQTDHMKHSLVWLNETMSHALKGHPRWMSHGREFRKTVVHWEREWWTTPVFLPWESHKQHEKAKRYDTERWTNQVSRCPICYWEKSGKITPERMKRLSQSNTTTQLMWLWWKLSLML